MINKYIIIGFVFMISLLFISGCELILGCEVVIENISLDRTIEFIEIRYSLQGDPFNQFVEKSKAVSIGPGQTDSVSFHIDEDAYMYHFEVWNNLNQTDTYEKLRSYFSSVQRELNLVYNGSTLSE
jgi:hypothetical protein